ncbi:hypothetical protein J3R30DRAFT_1684714 [Lentinula aciculospora]|uniref:Uncharacterized protein n=1 Tax=Lentinula aciculospora TaxID=153920 RepID=A0A9W9DFR9_9AGAR|nr:hypothetical protein J3R30DRAFT_1684714 [Lentinula aciculospora]
MAALSDHIDRLTHNTRSIKSTTASCGSSGTGRFSRAILTAELGDLIRDVDSSELGLLTITNPSNAVAHDKETRNQSGVEITRAEFLGATPLRRTTGRRDESKPRELLPEVYGEAALKYMDRYQHIRPMPRAHQQVTVILERLEQCNERIRSMTEQLKETQTTEAPSLKSAVDEEQHRIDEVRSRINAVRKHKDTVLKQKLRVNSPPEGLMLKAGPSEPQPAPVSSAEEKFWSTPSYSAKPLQFIDSSLLLDEEAEFGNISMASSISSPIPSGRFSEARISALSPQPSVHDVPETSTRCEDGNDHEEDNTDEGIPSSPSPMNASSQHVVSSPELESPKILDTPHKEKKIRINMDIERAVAKIWSTVGDLVMPGNTFNKTTNLPPVAKATISHLQSLSSLTPTVASPTQSISTASKGGKTLPTTQQILTAHLLLNLIYSETLSLPLNKVKELLAAKASTSGSTAMVSGRPKALYGCVAKRLLKIERGAAGQIVKFDI